MSKQSRRVLFRRNFERELLDIKASSLGSLTCIHDESMEEEKRRRRRRAEMEVEGVRIIYLGTCRVRCHLLGK